MEVVLIKQVQNGNEHAFRLLVEKYRIHIYKVVYGVLRNQSDAEDATQEVFVKIYTSLSQYNDQGFKTWMTRIAVNHAIDIKRKQVLMQEDVMSELQVINLKAAQIESTEEYYFKKIGKKLIRRRINELPKSHRDVIIGFYIKGKSYRQLAEEQQVQVKTIETKLYRARQWMKKNWKEDDFL